VLQCVAECHGTGGAHAAAVADAQIAW